MRLGLLKLPFVQPEAEGLARDRFAGFRQAELDKLKRSLRLGFTGFQTQQQLVSRGRTLLHGPQFPEQPCQLAPPHGSLLGLPTRAQNFAPLRQQLDLDRFLDRRPGLIQQGLPVRAAVDPVFAGHGSVLLQRLVHHTFVKPLPVQPPLAARLHQPVHRQ